MLQGDEDDVGWPGVKISGFWHCLSMSLHVTELELVLPFSFLLQFPGSRSQYVCSWVWEKFWMQL